MGGKTEDLPEGEVPRHHRQHGAEGLEGDEAAGHIAGEGLVGEEAGGVLRVVVAGEGALLHLGLGLGDHLAHLGGDDPGQPLPVTAQALRGGAHQPRPLGEAGVPPPWEDGVRLSQGTVDVGLPHDIELRDGLSGGRIDRSHPRRLDRHHIHLTDYRRRTP